MRRGGWHTAIDFLRTIRNRAAMPPLFRDIERHLEYHGYKLVFEDGVIKTDHATKPKFWVHQALGGAQFITIYRLGQGAKDDRALLYEFVNRSNAASTIARFSCEEDFLSISAWYPNIYEKHAFSTFFDQYLAEIDGPAIRELATVRKLFWDEPPEAIE